jgi:hypothetical protein
VRSHAKASSEGSNPGRGKSRRSLRRPGALAALLVALVAAACLLPGSAFAIEFRTATESFGPDGTSGTTFERAISLAFDQGNKRLYALDQEAHQIDGYDASTPGSQTPLVGNFPLAAPGSDGLDAIATDSSSHHLFYASHFGGTLYGFDEGGNALGGNFPVTGRELPCGAAVDSSGNIWLAETEGGGVGRFRRLSPAGVGGDGQFTEHGEPCGLAFDAADNLYVSIFFGPTYKYTAANNYINSTLIDPETSAGVAVDKATGEVFVVHTKHISVWNEEGEFLYEFGEPLVGRKYNAIVVNEATEEVYVSDFGNHLVQVFGPPVSLPRLATEPASGITAGEATVNGTVNPKGKAVEECHFEVVPAAQFFETKYENVTEAEKYPCVPAAGSIPVDSEPHALSAGVTGLNPAMVYHYRLVATNEIGEAKSKDAQFTTGPAAPLVQEESVESVGTSGATLSAKINPRGGKTTYHLEYGTTNAYGQSTVESAPFGFASDTGKHTVSVHIGGLQPGTAYHFRFVATNLVATIDGGDVTFATYPTAQSFAPCSNDEFRTGAGARLPDCRAYEQGTPIDKHGANAMGSYSHVGASASGDRFTFFANGGLPVSGGLSDLVPFLADRGPGGWSSDGLLPLAEPGFVGRVFGVNEDLTAALVTGEGPGGVGEQLFVRDGATATFEPGPAISGRLEEARVVGFAADPHHLAFISETKLLPSAPEGKSNLYDLDHGALTLLDRVPSGSATSCDDEAGPACEVPPGGSVYQLRGNAISDNGTRAFFTLPTGSRPNEEAGGRIYMREDGARTTLISASQRTVPDPNGARPARLAGVTPDGSKVFFLSCEKLTDDSTAASNGEDTCIRTEEGEPLQGSDLYVYDVESGELTDLTVDSNVGDPFGAAVAAPANFHGISEDGSYVYFFANGVLAPGASPGNCWSDGSRECNLYVYHGGATTFIAHIHPEGESRVSADGSKLLFATKASLTGYDNVGPCGNGGTVLNCQEYFRYSAPEEKLLCVTCVPAGIPPSGGPRLGLTTGGDFVFGSPASGGPPRIFSADGNRFFFDSFDALLPGDTNGVRDVYEWEAKGEGSCQSESQDGGCLYLISSGTDPVESGLLDASKSGDHVFFLTEQQLVPGDEDHLYDVYDAGVGAGLSSQHALAPPTCASTACQANPPPPPDPSLASAAYSGAGNAHQRSKARRCPKGKRKVRSGGKVHCQKASKQRKRHTNRGGSK